jgi:hypothetical protein
MDRSKKMTARVVPLHAAEAGDGRTGGTIEERLAAVDELTAEAGRLAGLPPSELHPRDDAGGDRIARRSRRPHVIGDTSGCWAGDRTVLAGRRERVRAPLTPDQPPHPGIRNAPIRDE